MGKEIGRVAVVAAANARKRELDALQFRFAAFDFEVTRSHNEVDVVK